MRSATGVTPDVSRIQAYVDGKMYPANKRQIIDCARENGAPHEVINALACMPDLTYRSAAHVCKVVNRLLNRRTIA